jgi:hypothetical protein
MWTARWWRRLRFGDPIVIVSGLPRSGTSMMMQMLAAGGLAIVSDGQRVADESNPAGYFELEAVKDLDKRVDQQWLAGARGRGVKIVSPLLQYLPDTHNYKVIFMERPLPEVLSSQDAMLARSSAAGEGSPVDTTSTTRLTAEYEAHLRRVHALLARRACFEALRVSYGETIADPRASAERVTRFVGGLDVESMAATVNVRLYRQRR